MTKKKSTTVVVVKKNKGKKGKSRKAKIRFIGDHLSTRAGTSAIQANLGYSVRKPAEAVCSIFNPFCPEANGAKLFDDNSSRSCVFQARTAIAVTVDTNGASAFYFTHNPNQMVVSASTITSSAVVAWGATNPNAFYSTVGNANIGSYRVVSWGVHYKTTLPWTTATGLMVVSEQNANTTATTGQNVGSMQSGMDVSTLAVRDAEFWYSGKPLGNAACDYIVGAGNNSYINYTTLLVTVVGGPVGSTQTIGYADVIVNYEWTPPSNGAYDYFSSPAAPSVPEIMGARADLAKSIPLVIRAKDAVDYGHTVMGTLMDIGSTLGSMASMVSPAMRGMGMMGRLGGAALKMLGN
jgi:hypothetical protein